MGLVIKIENILLLENSIKKIIDTPHTEGKGCKTHMAKDTYTKYI